MSNGYYRGMCEPFRLLCLPMVAMCLSHMFGSTPSQSFSNLQLINTPRATEMEYNPPLHQVQGRIESLGQERGYPPTPTSGPGASFPTLSPFGPWNASVAAAALASPSTPAPAFGLPHRPADSAGAAGGHERRAKMARRDSAEDLKLDGRVDCMVFHWEGDEMPTPTYEEPDADGELEVEVREEEGEGEGGEEDETRSTVSTGGSWYELDNEDCLLTKERGHWA